MKFSGEHWTHVMFDDVLRNFESVDVPVSLIQTDMNDLNPFGLIMFR